MRVLSLFDWIACWYEALKKAWISIDAYYASEIDKYAIQIALKNHPDIIEIWDVCKIKWEDYQDIDLLIGGSPCQWFSMAGKMLNFEDPRSKLFFEYVRVLKEVKPKYFLLENVKMKKEYQDVISEQLWVQPIEIDSALLSWQRRKRLYWTNIPWITQPQDKWIMLKDILETNASDKYNLTEKWMKMLMRNFENKWLVFEPSVLFKITYPSVCEQQNWLDRKCPTLTASMWTGGNNVPCLIEVPCATQLWQSQNFWTAVGSQKAYTLRASNPNWVIERHRIRKLTPIECERLQTLPDNYTEWVSDSQRYKMLWNWWTVDVIAHIFSFIPKQNG